MEFVYIEQKTPILYQKHTLDNNIKTIFTKDILFLLDGIIMQNNTNIGTDESIQFILEYFKNADSVTISDSPYTNESLYNDLPELIKEFDKYIGAYNG